MLTITEAKDILESEYPEYPVLKGVDYNDLYVFMVDRSIDPGEEFMDPFFSVNKATREARDYSIFFSDPQGILGLFETNPTHFKDI